MSATGGFAFAATKYMIYCVETPNRGKGAAAGRTRLVRGFRPSPSGANGPDGPDRWPATVPAAAQLLREGLDLPPGITILVGENGSGKSTVVEMMAEAYELNPQGGSILASRQARVRQSEPGAGDRLVVEREPGRHGWAYFLRADTMHSLYTYLEQNPSRAAGQNGCTNSATARGSCRSCGPG